MINDAYGAYGDVSYISAPISTVLIITVLICIQKYDGSVYTCYPYIIIEMSFY